MNSGLVEAREWRHACRGSCARRERRPLLQEFATETREAWQGLLGAGRTVRALAGADPWVRQSAARIATCIPASGDDLETLLQQIGPDGRATSLDSREGRE
jgi:hypothetical protein